MLFDLDQEAGTLAKPLIETLRESLDSPYAQVSAEIGEKYDARDPSEEVLHCTRYTEISGDDSRCAKCKFHCGTDEDQNAG